MPSRAQYWGSEGSNNNARYGYTQWAKPRWEQMYYKYQDAAALERFGIDPMRPAPGVVMMANPYGYPIDGYTTGYTMKLPPPAEFELAARTPRSSNMPSVIETSDGTTGMSVLPGDSPVDYVNDWQYGDPEMRNRLKWIESIREFNNLLIQARIPEGRREQLRSFLNGTIPFMK